MPITIPEALGKARSLATSESQATYEFPQSSANESTSTTHYIILR
jgi:hypothetical protein